MNYAALILTLLLAALSHGQIVVIDSISKGICDSLSNIEAPLDSLTKDQSRGILRSFMLTHYESLRVEKARFFSETEQDELDFSAYLVHYLQHDCKDFRKIADKLDPYLKDRKALQALYFQSKAFIFSMEDNANAEQTLVFLGESARTIEQLNLLRWSQNILDDIEKTSTLSIILVYDPGYIFRVRYFDYRSGVLVFQVDVIFSDTADLLIDRLEFKDEAQETQSETDYDEVPPPPPAPGGG